MSFIIYKTVSMQLSYNSTYTHYDLEGSSGIRIKYAFINKTPNVYFHFGTSDDGAPSTSNDISLTSATYTNFYTIPQTYDGSQYPLISTIAYVTQLNALGTTDETKNFYLVDKEDASKIELTPANLNAPTSMSILETFPKNKSYNLMNGSFVTYAPNRKKRIVIGFEYLPETTLENFINLSKKPVILVPEADETNVSPFEGIAYACNWEGSELNFQYSAKYKKAGYSGNISFREI